MNLCVVSGKVVNEVDFKFIYNAQKKSLGKGNISVVVILLELDNQQVIELHAYNEMADFFYQKITKGDYILVQGKLRSNFIEVSIVCVL